MSYGKVHDVFWDGEKIIPLSDRAALLALYLITGRHRNAIGCFKLGIGALTDEERFKKWGIEGVSQALSEMVGTGFLVRDAATGWTLITNALTLDPIKGFKAGIHAAKLASLVPASSPVYVELKQRLEPQLDEALKGQKDVPGWPMRSPIEGVSKGDTKPNRSPDPSPLPEPEPLPFLPPQASANSQAPSADLDIPETLDKRKAARLPADWALTDHLRQVALEVRACAKLPPVNIELEAEKFRDYWHAKSGKDATKTDWLATWRNWIRNARPAVGRSGAPVEPERSADEWNRRFGIERPNA